MLFSRYITVGRLELQFTWRIKDITLTYPCFDKAKLN